MGTRTIELPHLHGEAIDSVLRSRIAEAFFGGLCKNITTDHFQAASQRIMQRRHLGFLFRFLQFGRRPLVGTP